MWLAVRSGGFFARRHVRLFGLGVGAAAGLAQRGRGDQVLDDGAVASKLVCGGAVGALGSGFGNERLQH